MKNKTLLNTLIAVTIVALIYVFVGHDFVSFHAGGKTDLLATAAQINQRCNADGACPTTLEGWRPLTNRGDALSKGNMLYLVTSGEADASEGRNGANRDFKLIFRFMMPDDWFEARGGVGQAVTSGWTGR